MKKIIGILTFGVIIVVTSCNNNSTTEQTVQIKETNIKDDSIAKEITQIQKEQSNTEFLTYYNERFGFHVDYPSQVLFPQGESDNGDGQVFSSKNSENTLRVYRDYQNLLDPEINFTIQEAYNIYSKSNSPEYPKRTVTYKKLGKRYFVVSGYDNGKIFYQKTILSNEILATCVLTYKESEREFYDKISERIFKSFEIESINTESTVGDDYNQETITFKELEYYSKLDDKELQIAINNTDFLPSYSDQYTENGEIVSLVRFKKQTENGAILLDRLNKTMPNNTYLKNTIVTKVITIDVSIKNSFLNYVKTHNFKYFGKEGKQIIYEKTNSYTVFFDETQTPRGIMYSISIIR